MPDSPSDGLTPRQRAFVQEYQVDWNATQAAIRAGYSPNGADVAGSRMLANVRVRRALDVAQGHRADKLDIQADDILEEVANIAFEYGGDTKSRLKALELLGKHRKLWTDKVEHSGPDGGPLQVCIEIHRTVRPDVAP